jgi:hypothetical protein
MFEDTFFLSTRQVGGCRLGFAASRLPNKRENKRSSGGKREITQQCKDHQSCQLIGFCHFSLHWQSLLVRAQLRVVCR